MSTEDQNELGIEDEGIFELNPGDLAIVIRDGGDTETYFAVEEEEETEDEEANARARYMAEFVLFALGNKACQDLFAKSISTTLN